MTRQKILKAKGEGKDISQAEEMFKKAEPLLKEMNLPACMDVVNQINAMLADLPDKPPAPPEEAPAAGGGGSGTDVEKQATCQEAIDSIGDRVVSDLGDLYASLANISRDRPAA